MNRVGRMILGLFLGAWGCRCCCGFWPEDLSIQTMGGNSLTIYSARALAATGGPLGARNYVMPCIYLVDHTAAAIQLSVALYISVGRWRFLEIPVCVNPVL
jgi:hypothetical protein